jgi:hypothetical protein
LELFNHLVQPPLVRRRDEFVAQIAERLHALEQRGINFQALTTNAQFLTTVQHVVLIALRTHSEDKLSALRNCILNVAAGTAPEARKVDYFVAAIDGFTEVHIRMLIVSKATAAARVSWMQAAETFVGLPSVVDRVSEQLGIRRPDAAIVTKAWNDLLSLGLVVSFDGPDRPTLPLDEAVEMSADARPLTLPLADELLKFIAEPQWIR